MKILIVEDVASLEESIAAYLKNEEYTCDVACDYRNALEKTDLHQYDCILLDISLPGGSGLQILRELKSNHKTDGVLIISAKNSVGDKIAGLKSGAHDYLAKPFHLSELSARISAIIRRKNYEGIDIVQFQEISVDTLGKTVKVDGKEIDLTKKEYLLLLYFISNKGRVISKNAIAEHLWGDETEGDIDFIYTHIKNLRKKLQEAGSDDYIISIYGMGYKFADR